VGQQRTGTVPDSSWRRRPPRGGPAAAVRRQASTNYPRPVLFPQLEH